MASESFKPRSQPESEPAERLGKSVAYFANVTLGHPLTPENAGLIRYAYTENKLRRKAEVMRKREARLARVDELTGLPNRRYFREHSEGVISATWRHGDDISLLMLDIDHFKSINDRYGHEGGDEALKFIANILASQTRGGDFVARYGGEEFTVLLTRTDSEGARNVAEKLREGLEQGGFAYRGEAVPTTASIGIASYESDHLLPIDKMLRDADAALYEAKNRGRNQSVVYEPGMVNPGGKI